MSPLGSRSAKGRFGWKADISFGILLRMTAALRRKPTFRIAVGQWLHISGWPAILIAPIVIPMVVLLLLGARLFGLKLTADRTPKDVESYLRDFLDGRGGDWHWDDFTSIRITDPTLDAIREQAQYVDLPLDGSGRATLEQLLEQVRAM